MIGIILVTHGRLGSEFLSILNHMMQEQSGIEAFGLGVGEDLEKFKKKIADAVHRLDQGNGVIILTDIFGGSPSTLVNKFRIPNKIEIISGLNLPMLLTLAQNRNKSLEEAIAITLKATLTYTKVVSDISS